MNNDEINSRVREILMNVIIELKRDQVENYNIDEDVSNSEFYFALENAIDLIKNEIKRIL